MNFRVNLLGCFFLSSWEEMVFMLLRSAMVINGKSLSELVRSRLLTGLEEE